MTKYKLYPFLIRLFYQTDNISKTDDKILYDDELLFPAGTPNLTAKCFLHKMKNSIIVQ